LEDFRSYYTGVNPLALTVGEIQAKSPQVAEYTEGDELDLAFEFDLASSTLNGVNGNTANFIKDALKTTMREFEPNQFATFLTNHDIDRVATKLFHDQDKMKMAAGVLFTIPGVPFIYYGEEIGMAGAKPDPQIRTPMQWTPGDNAGFTTGTPWTSINGDYKTTNVETQSADADSLLTHYRRLIQARNQHVALRLGDYQPVEAGSTKVLSFMRSSDDEKVMVVINLGKDAIDEYSLNLKEGNLSGSYRLASIFQSGDFEPKPKLLPLQANASGGFDDFRPFEGPLPAYSISIFQLQPEG
jgi:glycosidase